MPEFFRTSPAAAAPRRHHHLDGNGSLGAGPRACPRTVGHQRGIEAVKRALQAAGDLGIEIPDAVRLLDRENWARPAEEVGELMRLLRVFLRSEVAELHRRGVRLKVIGERRAAGPDDIVKLIEHLPNT